MARLTSRTAANQPAVHGVSTAEEFVAAVTGTAASETGLGPGVLGESKGKGPGVFGRAGNDAGVIGYHGDPALHETTVANEAGRAGVFGASESGAGVLGYSRDENSPAVFAFGGFVAIPLDREFAGEFRGHVRVDGDIVLSGADCAEQFDTAEDDPIAPGAVVVIGGDGMLRQSREAYDRRVAGVVSGAGGFRPGIVLDNREPTGTRATVALMGKAFCKVDAQYSPISVGDLLTTSSTPGHAMKAVDRQRSFGATIGKALRSHHDGTGLIPVLVSLG